MPAACCTTPVTADGNLFFAGWSPGDPDDKDFQFPAFDSILKDNDTDETAPSRKRSRRARFKDLFDNNDTNKDGKITRDEWDAMVKYAADSKNSAFALKPGGSGDVTESNVLWKQTKGLPYVSSAILYRGQYLMVKDGGMITAYDETTGKQLYQKRLDATGSYYASPVAAERQRVFRVARRRHGHRARRRAPQPKVVAKNPPLGERTAATPAIADERLRPHRRPSICLY